MAHEVELKLRLRARDAARLQAHPAVTAAARQGPLTRKLTSIYYDTPQLALLDAGLSLRVRRMGGQWFQAVKGAGHALAGLHQREEWEDIIAHGAPDFSKITDPALTRVFDDPDLRAALRPIFTTEVRRSEWQLEVHGSHIELALDQGRLVAGDHREPICEIELELKQGEPAQLFELALALQADIPLWIENVSKAQRGYARYRPQPPRIVKAGKLELRGGMPAAQAFRSIAWQCLAQLQGNQDMVLHGDDIEGVHQMRVALRRLRSAWSVFRKVLASDHGTRLRQEIAWITGLLGHARDLDVFLAETLPPVLSALPAHAGLEELRARAQRERGNSYAVLRGAIESQRYQRLLLGLGAWLEGAAWETTAAAAPLAELAATMLERRHRRLRRHGRRLLGLPPEERHLARIDGKKLRYTAEFFAALYPARKARPYLRHLAELQDALGALNDVAVTERLASALAGRRPSDALRAALAALAGWNACRGAQLLPGLDRLWQEFTQSRPFWR